MKTGAMIIDWLYSAMVKNQFNDIMKNKLNLSLTFYMLKEEFNDGNTRLQI